MEGVRVVCYNVNGMGGFLPRMLELAKPRNVFRPSTVKAVVEQCEACHIRPVRERGWKIICHPQGLGDTFGLCQGWRVQSVFVYAIAEMFRN